jgi:hypothetical protein
VSNLVLVLAAVLVATPAAVTRAAAAPNPCVSGNDSALSLRLRALTAADGTELTASVASSTVACAVPSALKKVQVKTVSPGGAVADMANVADLPSPGGSASVQLPPLERGRRLEVKVLVQTDQTVRTLVLAGETTVLRRSATRASATSSGSWAATSC